MNFCVYAYIATIKFSFLAEVIIDELLKKGVAHIYVAECITMRADDVIDMFAHKVHTYFSCNMQRWLNI